MLLNGIWSFLMEPQFEGSLLTARAIFILVSFVFLVIFIILFSKASWIQDAYIKDRKALKEFKGTQKNKFLKTWKKIKNKLEMNIEAETKLAIIEADKLLNEVFKRLGYPQKTMEEKLKNMPENFLNNANDILRAHQIRNNIINNPDYELSIIQAREIIEVYEQTFSSLQLL